ncbi:MAG TPA: hypothetical protein VMD31_07880 [Opitutaceae bacterium]|nr:hypothetical protein [Opitutaceae bacterium]
MTAPVITYVRLAGEVRGPFSFEQLRLLAESGVIAPATVAAARPDGPWVPLGVRPDAAAIFPARREFQFKEAEFERVNAEPEPRLEHREAIAAARRSPARDGSPPPAAPNDVLEMVRETGRLSAQYEAPVDLTPPPNRRRLDYCLGMIAVNGLLAGFIALGRGNFVVTLYAGSGMVVFSAGFTWLMYGVLRRY